ncbi:MAG TPA: hypothetical protein VFI31_07190 [Pirellulales bacterium]|nr:hypothetical protein [Pirellulales bacterium]
MRVLAIAAGLLVGVYLPAAAQERDVDDPVPYDRSDSDYRISHRNFGAAYYPHFDQRNSPTARRYDNRDGPRYPAVDPRSRYARNYGPPERTGSVRLDRYGRPLRPPAFDDPDPFDRPYSESLGEPYIPPDANNFRGGRYASDYPGFRGGWYGRGHRIRIRAGEYTAGDYANAFWEHQHHARAFPGEHNWNWVSGQGY